MSRKKLSLFQLIRNHTMFTRIIVSFICVGIGTMTVSTVLQYNSFSQAFVREIGDNISSLLDKRTQSFADQMEWVSSYSVKSSESAIKTYALTESTDEFDDYKAWVMLREIKNNNPFIDSLYIVNGYTGKVVDTQIGTSTFEDFYDQDIIRQLQNGDTRQRKLLQARELSSMHNDTIPYERQYLTIIYLYEWNRSKSAFIVNMNTQAFSQYFQSGGRGDASSIVILDGDNRIVADSDGSHFLSASDLADDIPENSRLGWVTDRANNRLIAYSRFSFTGAPQWKIVQTVPLQESFAKVDRLRDATYWLYSLLLLLTLIVVWLISRGVYVPVRRLMNNVLHSYSAGGAADQTSRLNGDEISILSRVFQLQKQEIHQLNMQRSHAEKTSKEMFLRDLLHRGYREYPRGIHDIGPLFAKHHVAVPTSSLAVAVFRMDNDDGFKRKYTAFDQHLIYYAMANIINEIMEKHGANEAIDMKSDHVALICEAADEELSLLADCVQECKLSIEKHLRLSVTVAVSGYVENAESLHSEYRACFELTNERFALGHGHIITRKPPGQESVFYQYPEDKERLLLNELKLGHADGVIRHFEHFLDQILKYSYSESRISLLRLLMSVAQTLKQMRIENEMFANGSISVLEQQLERLETADHFRSWFYSTLQEVSAIIRNHSVLSEKHQLLDRIERCVREHLYNPNLSTKFIAERLQLSPVYIRQFFKEETGESLSGYMNALKLKRVQQRLVETDMSVEDIAMESSFLAIKSFYTIFKRSFGMTPVQYRNMMREQSRSAEE